MLSLARDTKGKKEKGIYKITGRKSKEAVTLQNRKGEKNTEKVAQQQVETKTKQNKILLWKHKLHKQI